MSSGTRTFVKIGIRIVFVVLLVFFSIWFSAWVKDALQMDLMPHNEAMLNKIILLGLIAYVLLTAIPFVPGAEIGIAMLTAFGGSIAPLLYFATVLALTTSFLVGRLIKVATTARFLRAIRMTRAAGMLEEISILPHDQALGHLLDKSNNGVLRGLTRYRYVALAVLINIPGNAFIGGGGGIAMVAGLTRVFHPVWFVVTILLAVLPVPAVFFLFVDG